MNNIRLLLFAIFFLLSSSIYSWNAYAEKSKQHTTPMQMPNSVREIAKENTFLNTDQELPSLEPSELTKELMMTSKSKIENLNLIRMLNETSVNKSPFAVGMRASIFLGEWPLAYHSEETIPNWEYQKINTNFYDNRAGTAPYQIHYVQEAQKTIKGGLSTKVSDHEEVQNMILKKAMDKTGWPLSFSTVVGANTKQNQVYNIAPQTAGYLYAYAPAVHEKGRMTYGEVYLVLNGWQRSIVIKNITSHKISAWIPLKNHLAFGFKSERRP
ncbi:hypothetical protein JOC78_003212 [Bacillus ectoiniformans]|uniref:YfkD famly protein n=1 Tax=Bacillus ectoiniformans TaxID=1494429 RepID=UPI00195AD4AD|nr:YfkD famly protein [Bacillus ectoiniformans]MBM7650227.1 hypothetical protein [Bacillus ectoiniformans]